MGKIFDFFRNAARRGSAPPRQRKPGSGLEAIDEDGLDFFNALSATLEVELTVPAAPVAGLSNLAAPAEATLVSVALKAKVFDEAAGRSRSLTGVELDRVVFRTPGLRLRGESGAVVWHDAPDGARFTVRDLLRAVEETERRTRGDSEWLGGIDVHHCFFEGITQDEEGVWEIAWGS